MKRRMKGCIAIAVGFCVFILSVGPGKAQTLLLLADPPQEVSGIWQYTYNVFNVGPTSVTITKITIEDGPDIPATFSAMPSGWSSFQGPDDKIGWYSSGATIFGYSTLGPFTYKVARKPRVSNWEIETTTMGTKTGGPTTSAVPVELLSFSARVAGANITLSWATASETENLGFFIYRSPNPEFDFQPINRELIRGAGNSSQKQNYEWNDAIMELGKTYYYKLGDVDFSGNITFHGPISVATDQAPAEYALHQNFPNPFNPNTTIQFNLPEPGKVTLAIYDIRGRLIRTLVSGDLAAGTHSFLWDGTSGKGTRVASGIYLYELKAKDFTARRKLVFNK